MAIVCRRCGEPLEHTTVVIPADDGSTSTRQGYQHTHLPGAGTERDHLPEPAEAGKIPMYETLLKLSDGWRALGEVRDPVDRIMIAKELADRSRNVAALVRALAAKEAVDGGAMALTVAQKTGMSPARVNKWLRTAEHHLRESDS